VARHAFGDLLGRERLDRRPPFPRQLVGELPVPPQPHQRPRELPGLLREEKVLAVGVGKPFGRDASRILMRVPDPARRGIAVANARSR
jgi:hypothetical protein